MPKPSGPSSLISAALEKHNKERQESRTPREPLVFWPSEASVKFINSHGEEEVAGKCHRQQYWAIKGKKTTNKTNARSIRIWAYGNHVEAQEILGSKYADMHVSDGAKFEHLFGGAAGLMVRGKLDAVYHLSNVKFGMEYKSGYGPHFRRNQLGLGYDGKRMKSDPGEPRLSNVLQVMLYLDHFKDGVVSTSNGQYTQDPLKVFFLTYVDRGDGAFRDYKITLNSLGHPVVDGQVDSRTTVSAIYERFEELQGYLDRSELPPPDFIPYYSDERVETLYARGGLTKKAYELHQKWKAGKKTGRRAGFWSCNGYCPYETACKRKIREDAKNAAKEPSS
jgi:hypothetical protein